MSLSALDQFSEEIKGKNVVCVISGSNNDITRTAEIKERALLYANLKHYFIIKFPLISTQIVGKTWQDANSLALGKQILVQAFTPIDDVRASGEYRKQLLENLWHRFWLETNSSIKPLYIIYHFTYKLYSSTLCKFLFINKLDFRVITYLF